MPTMSTPCPFPPPMDVDELENMALSGNLLRLQLALSGVDVSPEQATHLLGFAAVARPPGARACWGWLLAMGANPHGRQAASFGHTATSARCRPPEGEDATRTPHNGAVAAGRLGWIQNVPPVNLDDWMGAMVVALEHGQMGVYRHLWRHCPVDRPEAVGLLKGQSWPVGTQVVLPDTSGTVGILDLAMPFSGLRSQKGVALIRTLIRDGLTDRSSRTRFALRLLEGVSTCVDDQALVDALKVLDTAGLDWEAPYTSRGGCPITLSTQLAPAASWSHALGWFVDRRRACATDTQLRNTVSKLGSPRSPGRPRL